MLSGPATGRNILEWQVRESPFPELTAFDLLGREVARFVDASPAAGEHTAERDGRDVRANPQC